MSVIYVELHLAGRFRVVRDGTELADGEIGSRKSRTLLKLLAVERPGLVPVDRIVEILWPDGRPAAPEQNVATLVSRLRAVLGADLIQGGRAGYRLADSPGITVDLDAAARFCEQAEGKLATAAAVALAAAERAHELLAAGTAIGDEPYADLGGSGPRTGARAAAPSPAGRGRGGAGDREPAARGGLRRSGDGRRHA